ncbi:zinc finger protein 62-like [Condylostylus longicornis]|uniref:zinc finger protein 62-like n=1 Tax=Condylostylus longicornis TaxID=2530218 RepID=UPI00244E0430|nr:zinc finger protein 62-like [Condylostylus longicornis]
MDEISPSEMLTELDPLNLDAEDNSNDQRSQNSCEEEDDDYYDDSDDFNTDDIDVANEPIPLKDLKQYEIPVGEIIYCVERDFKFECMYCSNIYDKFNLLSEHITEMHFPFNFIPTKILRRQNAGEIKCGKILMSEICMFVHVCFLCQEQFDDSKAFFHHILENHLGADGILKVHYKERNREPNYNYNNGVTSKPKQEPLTYPGDEDDEDKPCKCQFCNKGFKRDSDRKRHERIHTGEKPYKCDICDKAFTQSGTLKGHKRTHFFQKFRQ